MASISASVGRYANGTKECYNVLSDQVTVINLLNQIPQAQGGSKESPFSTQGLRWGVSPPGLYDAILAFQSQNAGLSVDGHVDPGGGTIAKLTQLAAAPSTTIYPVDPPSFPPDVPPPAQPLPPASGTFSLFDLFRKLLPQATPWSFTGSAGLSISTELFGVAFLKTTLHNDNEDDSVNHTMMFGGVSGGISVVPFGLEFSTSNMPSLGTRIFAAPGVDSNLSMDDLVGTTTVVSISATTIGVGISPLTAGGGGTLVLFRKIDASTAMSTMLAAANSVEFLLKVAFAGALAGGFLLGVSAGTPNAGITFAVGASKET
jgi:hypothetical protein